MKCILFTEDKTWSLLSASSRAFPQLPFRIDWRRQIEREILRQTVVTGAPAWLCALSRLLLQWPGQWCQCIFHSSRWCDRFLMDPNSWYACVSFVHLQRWCRRFVFLLNSLTDSDGDLGLANRICSSTYTIGLTNVCPWLLHAKLPVIITTVGAWPLILKAAFASCLLGTWGPSKHPEWSSKQTTECLSLQVIQFTSHKRTESIRKL